MPPKRKASGSNPLGDAKTTGFHDGFRSFVYILYFVNPSGKFFCGIGTSYG